MSTPTIYKTVIQVEILSDTPYEFNNLGETFEDIMTGDCSGWSKVITENQPIEGTEAIQAVCNEHGTDPSFFGDETVYDWWTEDTIGEK